jgi:hypothetical protein
MSRARGQARYDNPTLSNKLLQTATHSVKNESLVSGYNKKDHENTHRRVKPDPLKAVGNQVGERALQTGMKSVVEDLSGKIILL